MSNPQGGWEALGLGGWKPMRHHSSAEGVAGRHVMFGGIVEHTGASEPIRTEGSAWYNRADWTSWVRIKSASKALRPVSVLSPALSSIVDKAQGGPQGRPGVPIPKGRSKTRGGGSGVVPLQTPKSPDKRFESTPLRIGGSPPGLKGFPVGWPGHLSATTEEFSQLEVFHPDAIGLVAVNFAGDPDLGSIVYDLDASSKLHKVRWARLQSFLSVLDLTPGAPACGIKGRGLAWNIGRGGNLDGGPGYGLMCDHDLGEVYPIASRLSGIVAPASKTCQHPLGTDKDGRGIYPAHIATSAYFLSPVGGDGPLEFGSEPYEPTDSDFGIQRPVHLRWDNNRRHVNGCSSGSGFWRWQVKTPSAIIIPPEDPPPPWEPPPFWDPRDPQPPRREPQPPRGPITGGGGGGGAGETIGTQPREVSGPAAGGELGPPGGWDATPGTATGGTITGGGITQEDIENALGGGEFLGGLEAAKPLPSEDAGAWVGEDGESGTETVSLPEHELEGGASQEDIENALGEDFGAGDDQGPGAAAGGDGFAEDPVGTGNVSDTIGLGLGDGFGFGGGFGIGENAAELLEAGTVAGQPPTNADPYGSFKPLYEYASNCRFGPGGGYYGLPTDKAAIAIGGAAPGGMSDWLSSVPLVQASTALAVGDGTLGGATTTRDASGSLVATGAVVVHPVGAGLAAMAAGDWDPCRTGGTFPRTTSTVYPGGLAAIDFGHPDQSSPTLVKCGGRIDQDATTGSMRITPRLSTGEMSTSTYVDVKPTEINIVGTLKNNGSAIGTAGGNNGIGGSAEDGAISLSSDTSYGVNKHASSFDLASGYTVYGALNKSLVILSTGGFTLTGTAKLTQSARSYIEPS